MEFERRYKGRTAVERVNARVKVFWGADDGNVTGAERFHAYMATIMLVHGLMANWLAMHLETGIESGARAGGRRVCRARRKGSHRNGPMPRLTGEQ